MAGDSREGSSTPSHFTAQNATAEDLLKSQTVGLVHLADFRKRRAEALEQKEREAEQRLQSGFSTPRSGTATPSDGVTASQPPAKKKRKAVPKGKLSFGLDDDGEDSTASSVKTPRSSTPAKNLRDETPEGDAAPPTRKLGPNAALGNAPKIMTKFARQKETETRDQLRKEFLLRQEAVKATEILVPFVFYDGSNIPGGRCRVKKGDHIWLFLDRARKVGAELGVGGGDKSKTEWARVGVDDLMLVRGEIIIPHHYDFYYFILNKSLGFHGPLFDYSAKPSSNGQPAKEESSDYNPLSIPGQKKATAGDEVLEGKNLDPSLVRVVDRRWYERNKHIFPASIWEEFDPTKDYTKGERKDTEGNRFFFP